MNERKGTLVDNLNDFDGLCASMRPGKITDFCICLGRSEGGKPTYCMMRT